MVVESYADILRTKIMVLTMQAKSINDFLADELQAEENYIDHMSKSLEVMRNTVKILKFARESSIVHRERSTNNSRQASLNNSFAYSRIHDQKMKDDLNNTMHSGISGASAGRTPLGGVGLRNRLGSDNLNTLPPNNQKIPRPPNKTENTNPPNIIIQNNINKLNYCMPANQQGLKMTSERIIKKNGIPEESNSSRLLNLLSISSPTAAKLKTEQKPDLNSSLQSEYVPKKGFATRTHTIDPTLDFNSAPIPPIPRISKVMSAKEPDSDKEIFTRGSSKDAISRKIEEFKKEVKSNLNQQLPVNANESILSSKITNLDEKPSKQVKEYAKDNVGQLQSIISNMNQSVTKVIDNRRMSPTPTEFKKKITSSGTRTVTQQPKDSPNKLSPSKTVVSDAKKNFKDLMSMQTPGSFSITTIKPPRPTATSIRNPK